MESGQRNPSTNVPHVSSAKNSTSSLIFVPRSNPNNVNRAESKKYATVTNEVVPNTVKGPKNLDNAKQSLSKQNLGQT